MRFILEINPNLFIFPEQTIREGMSRISKNTKKILFVLDVNQQLIGSVSDGDIRRGLLAGNGLENKIRRIMNHTPSVLTVTDYENNNYEHRLKNQITPVIDVDGSVIFILSDISEKPPVTHRNTVLLMAGGFGKRLRPLTDNCPKPMLQIRDKPMLLHIIEQFKNQGFRNFIISTFYLPEVIIDFFGDGSQFGVKIDYLNEKNPMGTGGCLSLISSDLKSPILIANGDVYTNVNYGDLITDHVLKSSSATMVVRKEICAIPFGVVNVGDDKMIVENITEKPEWSYLVNAGIYCLSDCALKTAREYHLGDFDMPDFLNYLINSKHKVGYYEHCGQWEDLGTIEALNRASVEFFK